MYRPSTRTKKIVARYLQIRSYWIATNYDRLGKRLTDFLDANFKIIEIKGCVKPILYRHTRWKTYYRWPRTATAKDGGGGEYTQSDYLGNYQLYNILSK